MKRKGVVLMITLILITIIMGIVSVVLVNGKKLNTSGNSNFSKSSSMTIINDLGKELPILFNSLNGPEELDLIMKVPFQIESEKNNFSIKIEISSPYQKININQLLDLTEKPNNLYISAFMKLFSIYPISDQNVFLNILLDTLDTDLIERGINTEIVLTQNDMKNGNISNINQFYKILERYIVNTNDKTILEIPWKNYVGFEGNKIDLNSVNSETLSLLIPDLSMEQVNNLTRYRAKAFTSKEEAINMEPKLSTVYDNFFFIFQQNLSYNLLCEVNLIENETTEHIMFDYNLQDKKIRRIEFL
jgi:hypothetical protein